MIEESYCVDREILAWELSQLSYGLPTGKNRKEVSLGNRPGLKYAAVQRFNHLMPVGQKRSETKTRERTEPLFSSIDGIIRALATLSDYQKIIMRIIDWYRNEHDIKDAGKRDNSQSLCQPFMRPHPQSLQWHLPPLHGSICSLYAFLCCFVALYATLHLYSRAYIHGRNSQSNGFCLCHEELSIKRAFTTLYGVNYVDRRSASHKDP